MYTWSTFIALSPLMKPSRSDEVIDQTWDALIQMALKYQNRLGKFRSARYDRHVVYSVINIRELAGILVEKQVITSWQGGFRRLSTIEAGVVSGFKRIHEKFHTDP